MPVVTVTLIEGYDEATRAGLSTGITRAVKAAIDAPLEGITVVINEVKAANYLRGGQRRQPGPPAPAPADMVRDYLAAMEARDLEKTRGFLAADFTMVFPGGATFRTPEELAAWAGERYRAIAKTYQGFDETPVEGGTAVYCFGTLSGTWRDGTAFSGIRFIDRFTVADGKLQDQQVWNDLAECR